MAQNRPDTKKRRREQYNVDIKLVEIYEDLASEKDDIRLKAAQALVSQFTPDKNPTDEQVQKTLQRLFRGLCSSRKAARIGFSIALTEVLSQVFASSRESSQIDVPKVLSIWESQSNASGSDSGQVRSIPPSPKVSSIYLTRLWFAGAKGPLLWTSVWIRGYHKVFYSFQA